MKKLLIICCVFALTANQYAHAQKSFPQILNAKFTLNAEWKTISDDVSKVLAGDLEDIGMFSCVDGKELWKLKMKAKFGKKKCTDWRWLESKALVKIEFKGEKKGDVVTYYIDDKTMEVVSDANSRTEKTKSNSKWQDKGTLSLSNPNVIITASYEKSWGGSAMSSSKRKVNLTCAGDVNWSLTFDASLVASLCGNSFSSSYFDNQLSLMAQDNKVFAIYEGITCLDLQSGKILWQTTFDNSQFNFGLFKSTQTVGRADFPLLVGNAIYIADLSKNNYCIKKLNAENGSVLWKSEPIDKNAVVPQLMIVNNTLIARFGGDIITQSYIPNSSNSALDVCKTEFKMIGDFGLKAYDLNSGKLLWETEKTKPAGDKFSNSISNIITDDKNIYVASNKNVFAFEPATGKVIFNVDNKGLDIGEPINLQFFKNDILIEGREGVARLSKADGKKIFGTNTGNCFRTQFVSDAFFVWTGKEPGDLKKFIRLDIETGTILGKIDDTYHPWFTEDGEEFVKFDGGKILRFKTK